MIDSAQSNSQDSRFRIRKHLVFKDVTPFFSLPLRLVAVCQRSHLLGI